MPVDPVLNYIPVYSQQSVENSPDISVSTLELFQNVVQLNISFKAALQ